MNLITLAFRIMTAVNACDPSVAEDVDAGDVAFCAEVELERIGLEVPLFREPGSVDMSAANLPASDECAQF